MMKIDKKITAYEVVQAIGDDVRSDDNKTHVVKPGLHEGVGRPEMLTGSTYKIKTPMYEHAFYLTVNDIDIETDAGFVKKPFEVFLVSKNMEQFQWISAITRLISAVFRKGGDVDFLVEELKVVFDPKGGYFKPGTGKFMPSLVAEIGNVIEAHLAKLAIGEITAVSQSEGLYEKETGSYPESAQICQKCNEKSLVMADGCEQCLNCGYSKCG